MNANDRFALELGRALVRALIAEAERDQAKAQLAEFTNGVEKQEAEREPSEPPVQ